MTDNNDAICCPQFNPSPWEDKLFNWENKQFIKEKVFTFFFIPLNFGSVMKKLDAMVRNADAEVIDYMCLSDHTSKWNMDVYLAVNKEIPKAENVKISGKFFSKVYEGPFKNTTQWCDDYKKAANDNGLIINKWYMWYTTCPKCAKKYGKNYSVIMCNIK